MYRCVCAHQGYIRPRLAAARAQGRVVASSNAYDDVNHLHTLLQRAVDAEMYEEAGMYSMNIA
jgi:hypothetical protein